MEKEKEKKKGMYEMVDERLRLIDAFLDLEENPEGEEELTKLLALNTTEIIKKTDTFRYVSETMTSMIAINKKIIDDTKESSERIANALTRMHKLYHGYIKYSLELESLNATNYRYIPRISKTSSVVVENLENEDLFVKIKMKKTDWEKISKSPTTKVKTMYDKVLEVKDANPTVTQLAIGHPAIRTEIKEYVYWKINTSKLPSGT